MSASAIDIKGMRPIIPLIELHDVNMEWDRKRVLSNVNLTVDHGDFMAITGPNGGGKTTLLRIMLRLLKPTTGSVKYLFDKSTHKIGYLPQKNMIDSGFPITVREVVESGLLGVRHRMDKAQKKSRVDAMIEKVGLTELASQSLGTLSGGQLQRALLGRALILDPKILVLDEPLSYVDKRFEHKIYDIVAELTHSTTIILVSHEISTIASMANRHVVVDREVTVCHSASHFVHYDCDVDADE